MHLKKKRIRVEWTNEENKVFTDAIKNKLNYDEIHKLLPHKTKSQIRHHYTYFSKEILKNIYNKKFRRLGKRGRPKNNSEYELCDENIIKFQKIIEELINSDTPEQIKSCKNSEFNITNNINPNYQHVPVIDYNFFIDTKILL